MKSSYKGFRVRVCGALLVVAGLIALSSCAEKKDEVAPAAKATTDAPAASATETVVEEVAVEEAPHVKMSDDQLKAMVTGATTGSGMERYTAIDDLGERAGDVTEVVPELEKNLADKDPQVVWRSTRALGDYGDEAVTAAPKLRELLKSEDPVIQLHAAIALGKVGDKSEETVDALLVAVGSNDPRVMRAAVAALKMLKPGPVKVAAALKKAMVAEDSAVAAQAIESIVELGPQAVPLLNEILKDPTTAYIGAAAAEQIGPDAAGAVPELAAVLGKTQHSELQTRVLLALGHIGPAAKSAGPAIVAEMEESKNLTVKLAAAFALGATRATDGDAQLKAAAASDQPFLAMIAAWSLAKIHPDDAELKKQAVEKLTAGSKSDDARMKAAAEKGLMSLEEPAKG